MKRIISSLIIILTLDGCNRVDNGFSVHDPKNKVVSAELQICKDRLQLSRSGEYLSIIKRIDCEGEGNIKLKLSDGSPIYCHIGYVSSGLEQRFEFELMNGDCSPSRRSYDKSRAHSTITE